MACELHLVKAIIRQPPQLPLTTPIPPGRRGHKIEGGKGRCPKEPGPGMTRCLDGWQLAAGAEASWALGLLERVEVGEPHSQPGAGSAAERRGSLGPTCGGLLEHPHTGAKGAP